MILSTPLRHRLADYGGIRHFLRHLRDTTAHRFGFWRGTTEIDWTQVRRLVFVCTGNVCRSPYAESYARKLGLETLSFGTSVDIRMAAHPISQELAAVRAMDLSKHLSTDLDGYKPAAGDLLVGFEPKHLRKMRRFLRPGVQMTLLGLWHGTPRPLLFDPYGHDAASFERCFRIIESACDHIADLLKPGHAVPRGQFRGLLLARPLIAARSAA